MADLKQALIWLAEGKKIKKNYWGISEFLEMKGDLIIDQNQDDRSGLIYSDEWELYEEPKLETGELIDDCDYIVWDKCGNRTFAYWVSDDKCFYPLQGGGFSLDVAEWRKLPERGL